MNLINFHINIRLQIKTKKMKHLLRLSCNKSLAMALPTKYTTCAFSSSLNLMAKLSKEERSEAKKAKKANKTSSSSMIKEASEKLSEIPPPATDRITILKNVSELSKQLGYTFNDIDIAIRALTRTSAVSERVSPVSEDFQRLEFIGDRILNLIICDIIYDNMNISEGRMTPKLNALTNNSGPLAKIALFLKLNEYMIVGRNEEGNGVRRNYKVLSDALEAMLGAIWIDSGRDYQVMRGIISHLYQQLGLLDTSYGEEYSSASQEQQQQTEEEPQPKKESWLSWLKF